MKRWFVAAVVLSVLTLSACTRTIVREAPAPASPASLGSAIGLNPATDSIVPLVQKVRPAVVNVTTDTIQTTPFGSQGGRGVGTGFIVRSDGVIVTNYHVVENAQKITVITPPPDTKRYQARVIGGDQTADLAVLKIDAQGLPTVPLGDSASLQLGQRVVAMGYALALEGGPTVTSGIVSALGRTIKANDPNCQTCANGVRTYSDIIQTDAAINPGNSGGPLLNLAGQVVGINSAGDNQAENIGFAIPIDTAKPTIEHAMSNPSQPVAYLGVVSQDLNRGLAYQFNLPVAQGAYVVDLAPNGPAESAGIKVGDVIVGFDGKPVTSAEALGQLIHQHAPGERVSVEVVQQDGARTTITATLGVNPLPQS